MARKCSEGTEEPTESEFLYQLGYFNSWEAAWRALGTSPLFGAGMRWAMNQGSCQAQMVLVQASPRALSFLTVVPGTWPDFCFFSGLPQVALGQAVSCLKPGCGVGHNFSSFSHSYAYKWTQSQIMEKWGITHTLTHTCSEKLISIGLS